MDINNEILRRCGSCRYWGNFVEPRNGVLSANCEVEKTLTGKTYTTREDGDCPDWEHRDAPPQVLVLMRILSTLTGIRSQLSRILIDDGGKNAVSPQEKEEQNTTQRKTPKSKKPKKEK